MVREAVRRSRCPCLGLRRNRDRAPFFEYVFVCMYGVRTGWNENDGDPRSMEGMLKRAGSLKVRMR